MSSTALLRSEARPAAQNVVRSGPVGLDTALGPVRLHVSDDWPSLHAVWQELQATAPSSAAQTYDWARAYARHVLPAAGRRAVVAVAYDSEGDPLFLWPFELQKTAGMDVLSWLGHDHANYNMGLFDPAGADLTAEDLRALLGAVGNLTGAAAAVLTAQPTEWEGVPNPFLKLPHQTSPNSGYIARLGDFDALFRNRFSKRSRNTLNRKERKLVDLLAVEYGWAQTEEDRIALLDIFFAQKSLQFAAMGVKDVFDAPARAFYREVALLEEANPSRLHLGYLKAGEIVAATFSGTVHRDRAAVSLSSLVDDPELQRYSPGALLLRHQIKEACDRGLALYDMGAGAARHKTEWCEITQPLFDNFIALQPQGMLLTKALALVSRTKRAIKTNPHVWPLLQRVRRGLLARSEKSALERGDAAEEA